MIVFDVIVVALMLVAEIFGAVSFVVALMFGADILFDKTSRAIIVVAVVVPPIVSCPSTSKSVLKVPLLAVKLLQETLVYDIFVPIASSM